MTDRKPTAVPRRTTHDTGDRIETVDGQVVDTSTRTAALGGRAGFKLTDARYAKIVGLVQQGNYLTTAAMASGIGDRTLMRWLAVGRAVEDIIEHELGEDHDTDPDSANPLPRLIEPNDWKCWRLMHDVRRVEAEAEAAAVLHIRKAMPENWTAAMTYLERKAPKRWRRRDLHEVIAGDAAQVAGDDDLLEPGGSDESHAALRHAAGLDAGEQADA